MHQEQSVASAAFAASATPFEPGCPANPVVLEMLEELKVTETFVVEMAYRGLS